MKITFKNELIESQLFKCYAFVVLGTFKTEDTFQITLLNLTIVFNFYKGPSNA